jgi:hypothetical protein
MISHLLTPEQVAIVRAGGTMLPIPGDECPECIDGCDIADCRHCGEDYGDPCQRHLDAGHVVSGDPYGDGVDCRTCCEGCGGRPVAPKAWLALTEPCDTCHGDGVLTEERAHNGGDVAEMIVGDCPDCVGGFKIIDLEEAVPCERGGEDIWAHVLVARATIQLLPVVADLGGRLPYPQVCVAERVTDQYLREWYVDADGDQMHRMINPTPDPLPVEEQDWVAALTIIERTS